MTAYNAEPAERLEAGVARRVLLVTTAQLTSNGVGTLFLRDLMAGEPTIDFVAHEEPPFLMARSAGSSLPRLRRAIRAGLFRSRLFHELRLRWFIRFRAGRRARTLMALAEAVRAGSIWVTTSSPEMIWIAERIAATGLDVRATVWDAPEYLSGNLRLGISLQRALMRSFGSLLRRANRVSVIGQAMRGDYQTRFGVEAEIIRHGIEPRSYDRRQTGQDIRIVFAGSLYSKDEWNAFVSALETTGWRIGNRNISLYFLGQFPLAGAKKPKEVVLLGEKPIDEALSTISTMDIGYLPYWFDRDHELVARTSFPGKMTAYAAAGVAVFHHGPSYTEATAFLKTYRFGLSCDSLQPHIIVETLSELVDLSQTDECREARSLAIRDELSRSAMAVRFRRFLAR